VYAEDTFVHHLARRILSAVPLLVVRLHGKKSELFDDCDRSQAEAEFRASVAFPVNLIVGSISFALGAEWYICVAVVLLGVLLGLSIAYRSNHKGP